MIIAKLYCWDRMLHVVIARLSMSNLERAHATVYLTSLQYSTRCRQICKSSDVVWLHPCLLFIRLCDLTFQFFRPPLPDSWTSESHGATPCPYFENPLKFEVPRLFCSSHSCEQNSSQPRILEHFWSLIWTPEGRKSAKNNFLQESEGCGRKCSPKFEVESYFVRNSVINKISLNLEFWRA